MNQLIQYEDLLTLNYSFLIYNHGDGLFNGTIWTLHLQPFRMIPILYNEDEVLSIKISTIKASVNYSE